MKASIYMQQAIALAKQAASQAEVPVGAVVVHAASGDIIAQAANTVEASGNACAHAELLALQQAAEQLATSGSGNVRLSECDLYVTLEPCAMCAGAISHARIRRLIFGAYDTKSGAVIHGPRIFEHSTTHHKPEIISGVQEAECSALLSDFFARLR